ncbi:MAG: ABC transporter substrate-binding protein [Rufibacter sp.]
MTKVLHWSVGLLLLIGTACSSSPTSPPPIRIRLPQDPESLHPLSYGNAHALQMLNLLYQSLLTVDLKDRSIQPLLAKNLPTFRKEDSLTHFTFQLHESAKWDNGTPVSVSDVSFSLKVLQSPALNNERLRAQYDFIKDILPDPHDQQKFTIVCRGFTPEMRLMVGDFFVLPQHKLDPDGLLANLPLSFIREKFDSLASTPTFTRFAANFDNAALARDISVVGGSGPYRLVKWQTGQHLLFEKKADWWGNSTTNPSPVLVANPAQILFQIIPDNAAATLALKARQLDLMDNIPLIAFQEMQQDPDLKKYFRFYHPPVFDLVFMGMNGAHQNFKDKRTRQALSHLLDVPEIVRTLQGGYATATVGLVHPQEKKFYHHQLAPAAFDTTKAIELLKQAGWQKKGTRWQQTLNNRQLVLEIEILLRAGNSDFENMALLFKQNAQKIGIPVTITPAESSQISERLQTGNFQMYIRTLSGTPFSYNFVPFLHTSSAGEGGANVTHFGTAETDALLERIAREENTTAKGNLLRQLQQKMQEESNLIFLYFQQNKIAISTRIDSVIISSLKPGYDVTRFSVKD